LEEKMRKQEEAEKKRVKKLEEYTNNILTWGLWQTEDQVDFHLNTDIKSTKDKIETLKAQLNFRRFVLQQKISGEGFKTIYNVTKMEANKRVDLKPEELAENVKKLINNAFTVSDGTNNDEDENHLLLGKHIQMYFEDEVDGTVKTTREGHVISTVYKFSL
jgi:hypothetical protein